MDNKHPIIAHGELYAEPISKQLGGGEKERPRNYAEAKQRVINDLDVLTRNIADSEEIFMDEKILCVRLEPKFEAKSYIPTSLVSAMPLGNTEIVGGRKYAAVDGDGNETSAKLYFLRTTDGGITQLKDVLENGKRDHVEQWRKQLQSIYAIDLLKPDEKVMGFENDWKAGTVEFVLHPVPSSTHDEVHNFFKLCGIGETDAQVRTYTDGITFISASCSMENLRRAKLFNPLRAVHPLGSINIIPIRSMGGSSCPTVYPTKQQPMVHIGVFDGGVDERIPLLKGYVKDIEGTPEGAIPELVAHGSGVCSAILYGNLAGKTSSNILDSPCASINCYRVLPLHDNRDYDLYEAIDLIESVVPNDVDTKLYNLSFGPVGAIVDDSISRFTYVLDKLSYEVPEGEDNPLFVVAAGNDGDLPPMFNRIQAPSDIVNGLGVGAYTFDESHKKVRASYSCVGPGREGAKTKPDLLDFGGSLDHPFIIPNTDCKTLSATAGTSFAAPMITGKIGQLMAMSKSISPHMGRTLLIHNASVDSSVPQIYQGFGFCPENVSDVLECNNNHVTIMYSGAIRPAQFLSLPIFAPRINEMKGNVSISWTVAVVVDPYSNDPDAYTNSCLEDVFSPHSMVYHFSKHGEKTKTINLLDETKIALVKQLLTEGYKRSTVPASHPAKKVWDEEDLRAVELKWDTVIHKSIVMRSKSLFNPTLTLHAIGRNEFEAKEIKYYVVITVDAPKYQGSLYDAVLQTYQNLTPIEIRNVNRITVN